MKKDLLSMTYEMLQKELIDMGEKGFRAKQIYDWIFKKNVKNINEMKNISKDLILRLEEKYYISDLEIVKKQISKLDGTKKYLFKTDDDNYIESVLMKYKFGYSICISSQIGCNMGCTFCASTINGKVRNLIAGEMLNQIYKIQEDEQIRISNVVVMGSGEPFDNYDNLLIFIKNTIDNKGLNIGQRHISVSTCGLVPKIIKFANERLQVNLAISMHAPNDELRVRTMPIAKTYKIDEIIDACKEYVNLNNRRINIEYALIKGINDSKENAIELSEKLKDLLCYVNLIPVNEIEETNYEKSYDSNIKMFAKVLNDRGIHTTIRRELGKDISAACGQLRNEYIKSQ